MGQLEVTVFRHWDWIVSEISRSRPDRSLRELLKVGSGPWISTLDLDLGSGLWSGKIEEYYIRAFLYSFENNFTSIWRDGEVLNGEFGREVGQLPLGTRPQVDEPQVLVLNLSSQEHEHPAALEEFHVSSSTSKGERRQGMRGGLGRDGCHGKRCSNIGARVENEASVWRPRGIDRVLLNEGSGGVTVKRNAEQVRRAVIICRGGDRLAVGCPCWCRLQIERIGHNTRVRAVSVHHV